jgi:hypothetical protein
MKKPVKWEGSKADKAADAKGMAMMKKKAAAMSKKKGKR